MLLNDDEIRQAISATPPLIENADPAQIDRGTYSFHIGRIFQPNTGKEVEFSRRRILRETQHIEQLGPNETAFIMTSETVNVPDDILLTYTPLNSLASQGLMMLNASVVEAGYRGPLSCVLVNFSSNAVSLYPGLRISKAVFFRMNKLPTPPLPQKPIQQEEYARNLARTASLYHKSFLDIASVAAAAEQEATKSAKKAIAFGGLFLLVLLAFAQFEPFVTKWLREKTGVMSGSSLLEMQSRELEIKRLRIDQEAQINELKRKVDSLEMSRKAQTNKK